MNGDSEDGGIGHGPLLEVRDLCVTHRRVRAAPPPFVEQRDLPQVARMLWYAIAPTAEQRVFAVSDVRLQVRRGSTLGILGETGAGKSSLARVISGALVPAQGSVIVDGLDVHRSRGDARRRLRRILQLIGSEPASALDPCKTIEASLQAVLRAAPQQQRADLLERVCARCELDSATLSRHPAQLDEEQIVRSVMARALVTEPELLLVDDLFHRLSVCGRALAVNLLARHRRETNCSLVVFAGDPSLLGSLTDRLFVLAHGRVIESGPSTALLRSPGHPYTRVTAAPSHWERRTSARRLPLVGGNTQIPDATAELIGCFFEGECESANERCRTERPRLRATDEQRAVACHVAPSAPANGS